MGRAKSKREQATFEFTDGWGGKREGAGPKPKGARAGVSHRTRAQLESRFPVHVTMRVRDGLPSLRAGTAHGLLARTLAEPCRVAQFGLVGYSVMSNHVHLVCEAHDAHELACGIQSLAVRIALRLNRMWGRLGSVFADRYHSRILRTPREVRYALAYVLNNALRHGLRFARLEPDPRSSGRWFEGWLDWRAPPTLPRSPLALAKTWLLTAGWRRHGLIRVSEVPGT
jgi:REP element-mobilizing transposase RayT